MHDRSILNSVHGMKVSTARENFKNPDNLCYVIIFSCSTENEEKIIEIGRNLLDHIEYNDKIHGAMYYTDIESYLLSLPDKSDMSKHYKAKITLPKY